jgi:hypothetical protein
MTMPANTPKRRTATELRIDPKVRQRTSRRREAAPADDAAPQPETADGNVRPLRRRPTLRVGLDASLPDITVRRIRDGQHDDGRDRIVRLDLGGPGHVTVTRVDG